MPAFRLIHPYKSVLKDKSPKIFQTGLLDLQPKWDVRAFVALLWFYVLEFVIRLDIRELLYTKLRVSEYLSLLICGCLLRVS